MGNNVQNKTDIYLIRETDPKINLALEEYLFWKMPADRSIILFYLNDRSVVMGKHQNPWLEINQQEMQKCGIHFIRRFTGGGTVYHDPGNINFSFISSIESHSPSANLQLICHGLENIGIDAGSNDKFDLYLRDKKISGSAFAIKRRKAIHHGTLLVEADLSAMQDLLRPSLIGISNSGTLSRRAEVMNIKEIDDTFKTTMVLEHLVSHIKKSRKIENVIELGKASVSENLFSDMEKKYRSWEWNYGITPKFTVTVGNIDNGPVVHVNKGLISDIENFQHYPPLKYKNKPFTLERFKEISYCQNMAKVS